jgi:hypothetical protein
LAPPWPEKLIRFQRMKCYFGISARRMKSWSFYFGQVQALMGKGISGLLWRLHQTTINQVVA